MTLQKRRTLMSSALNVQIDGRSIQQMDYAKLLGVIIGSDMSWEHHINTICCIISSRISLLRCMKPYLNFDSALRFYNSWVNNYFIYCCAAWGNCSLLRLLHLQKHAGRLLLDADLSQSSISLFLKLNWIPVFDLIKYRKRFLLFIVLLNPNAPKCLETDFIFSVICVNLWALLQEPPPQFATVPCPCSNSGTHTLAYSATKLSNDLTSNLKEFSISSSPMIFKFLPSSLKSKLRSLFLSRLSLAKPLEDLLCSTCRYSIHCSTTTTLTSINSYLHIYVYMFIYSTYFSPFPGFIYYSLRVYQ